MHIAREIGPEIKRGIAELCEAIPERIEVSGQAPTWKITGGSFDAVLAYANEAYDAPVVIARSDRHRWWHRVTLTVTTDPDLAADAPPLDRLRPDPPPPVEPKHRAASVRGRHAGAAPAPAPVAAPADTAPDTAPDTALDTALDTVDTPDEDDYPAPTELVPEQPHRFEDVLDRDDHYVSFLDEAFARQEALRLETFRLPSQRRRTG